MSRRRFLLLLTAAALLVDARHATAQAAPAALSPSFLYNVSNFDGVIPFAGVGLAYDAKNRELFVVGDGFVRIFNEDGMEIFAFGPNETLGNPRAVAPLPSGEMLVLYRNDNSFSLVRCNFRGEPVAPFEIREAPPEWKGFAPSGVWAADGKVFLASITAAKVMVTDESGRFEWARDLRSVLAIEDETEHAGLSGFGVDPRGNMLFTVQTKFRAYVLSQSGTLRDFGAKGSAPGKFNVVSGIAGDEEGNIYVADLLRCVVMVFGPDFKFITEFGYRGRAPGRLVAPNDVVVGDGKAFVSQNAARGVSVFRVRK